MLKISSWCVCALTAVALAVGTPSAHAAKKGLARLKGNYSGLFLISQGPNQILGTMTVKVGGNGKVTRIVMKGNSNGSDFTDRIIFKGHTAKITDFLPGVEGFSDPATGKFRQTSKGATATLEVPSRGWSMKLIVEPGAFKNGIRISGQADIGGTPVYLSVIAS